MKNSIKMKNISKTYKNFELKNINLDIPVGSITGIVGQNGVGKTTIIKLLLEIIKPDTGEIKLLEKDNLTDAKEEIGVILDDAFFPEILKVNDINKIMKGIYKNWDESLFHEYLSRFTITHNQQIKELSKGMKKKLEIAIALSHHPKLLILDEPTSGLDPIVRNEVLDIFLEFVESGENSIFLSSHITSDIEQIADYLIFMEKGEIIFQKEIEEIKNNYAIIKCSEKEFKKLKQEEIVRYQKNKYDYEVLINNKSKIKKEHPDLIIDHASIDDIMLLYVKGESNK